jgi:hypothetical protein
MPLRRLFAVAASLFVVLPSPSAEPAKAPDTTRAIERSIDFVINDAAKWREEKKCASCHHGTLTVWVLCEARSRGVAVDAKVFADTVAWTKERLKEIDKPRDTRPGWSMVSTPALNLAFMALAVPRQDAFSADELKKIAGHLVRHQEKDGSWSWASAPAANRPPPVFESDEVATLLALIDLSPHVPADAKEKSEVRDSRDRGEAWLAKATPTDTTQTAALRLYHDVRANRPKKELRQGIETLIARQNVDGGWGQVKDAASDAYATGQALYFLGLAGVKPDRAEVRKAVEFLMKTQKEDGSWPMTRRGHPGVTPGPFVWPIIYFGSAWGTLGLLRMKE